MGCYQLHGEVLRAKGLVLPPGTFVFLYLIEYRHHRERSNIPNLDDRWLLIGPSPTHDDPRLRYPSILSITGRAGPLEVDARMRFLGSLLGLASGVLAGLFGTGAFGVLA